MAGSACDGCLSCDTRIPCADRGLLNRPADGRVRRWRSKCTRWPDAVRGVVRHLFHESMIRMKAEGMIGRAASRSLDSAAKRLFWRKCSHSTVARFGKKHSNSFDFAGLYDSRAASGLAMKEVCRFATRFFRHWPDALFRMSGLSTFAPRKVVKQSNGITLSGASDSSLPIRTDRWQWPVREASDPMIATVESLSLSLPNRMGPPSRNDDGARHAGLRIHRLQVHSRCRRGGMERPA